MCFTVLHYVQLKQLVKQKKAEQETNFLDTATEVVFGKPDEGLTLPETLLRRASNTVLNSQWWVDQLEIEDGSGESGGNSSWEYRVYFNPDVKGSGVKLADHLDEEETVQEKRNRARMLYKQVCPTK